MCATLKTSTHDTIRREFFYRYECPFIARDKHFFMTEKTSVSSAHMSVPGPRTGLMIVSLSENLPWKIDIVAEIQMVLMYFLVCFSFQMFSCLDLKFDLSCL